MNTTSRLSCDCEDGEKGSKQLNNLIVMGFIRAGYPVYTTKYFEFCPWCGKKLVEVEDEKQTKTLY